MATLVDQIAAGFDRVHTILQALATPVVAGELSTTALVLQPVSGGNGYQYSGGDDITVLVAAVAGGFTPAYGVIVPVRQLGAGKVTITAASGVTLNAPNGTSTNGAGDARVLEMTSLNVWSLY